jgi:hypothetical protein
MFELLMYLPLNYLFFFFFHFSLSISFRTHVHRKFEKVHKRGGYEAVQQDE